LSEILVKCPICKAITQIRFNEYQVQKTINFINKNGKSPTNTAIWPKGHEFIVKVSVREINGKQKLYARDIITPINSNSLNESRMDWLKKHFG